MNFLAILLQEVVGAIHWRTFMIYNPDLMFFVLINEDSNK